MNKQLKISGEKIENVTINIDPIDCIDSLLSHYEMNDSDSYNIYYEVEDGKLYAMVDNSYHGSASYNKEFVSEDKNIVDLFISLTRAKDILIALKKQEGKECD